MDRRAKLTKFSTEDLKRKATKCGLADKIKVPLDRAELIDLILAHDGSASPMILKEGFDLVEPDPMVSDEGKGARHRSLGENPVFTALDIRTILASFSTDLLQQQQRQFEQFMQTVTARHGMTPATEVISERASGRASAEGSPGISSPTRLNRSPRTSESAPTGNIVSWLSSQIPEFSGASDEYTSVGKTSE